MTIPTRAEADALIDAPKIVTALATWRPLDRYNYKLELRVLAPHTGEILRLIGNIGKTNHSFVLLYHNYAIRKYTKHAWHDDPRQGRITVPHKHRWDADLRDAEVYLPDDIDPDSDINTQFQAFCRECNIELLGGYQAIAVF